ncbi:hypothetical protein K445DRAFT_21881 [Daldinia sp. EC12]|nr:hypothetical protein K445DRAFT_21881 [Daldinia sp. EC12]
MSSSVVDSDPTTNPARGSTPVTSPVGSPTGPGTDSPSESLTNRFEWIESAGLYGFTDHDVNGYHSAAPYFLHLYSRLLQLIRETALAMQKPNGQNERALLSREVKFLEICHEFVRDNAEELFKTKDFHYKLWARVEDFSRQGITSFDNRMSRHITRMSFLLGDHAPPPSESWQGDTLPSHGRFVRAYDEFLELDDRPLRNDVDRRLLMFLSQEVLAQALLGLRMPMVSLSVQENLFVEGARPTYVDFPYGSDEWLYGLGERPGVLELRRQIGGQITPEQEERIKRAKAIKNTEEPKQPINPKQPTDPKQPADSTRSAESRKRPAPYVPVQRDPKRPRAIDNYTITNDNIEADIQDIYSTAKFLDMSNKPDIARLLNPTAENREDTLNAYESELHKVLRQCRLNIYKPENPPQTQAERDRLMRQIENQIPRLRDEIHKKSDMITSASKLKEARVAAFTLKFIRTLHMKLLLASDPPPSVSQMRHALRDRLDDWILHEQAWNAADEKAIKHLRPGFAAKKNWLMKFVDARNQNIQNWWTLRDQLDEAIREEALSGVGGEGNDSGNGGGGGGGGGEAQEQAKTGETQPAKDQPAKDQPVDNQPVDNQPADNQPADNPPAPGEETKQAEETKEPKRAPLYWLEPRKAPTTVYFDEREEARREERARARAMERLLGPPSPGESYLDEERYRLEDEFSAKLAAAFPAHGGPPAHETIPRETVYDKIIYMFVMTHWRYFAGIAII